MGLGGKLLELALHPVELRSAIQFFAFKEQLHPRDSSTESASVKESFRLLKLTSRSFAAVIEELHPELRLPVTLFYLILRALDTVEDDMTLDPKVKIPLLRSFDEKLKLKDWTFDGSGPNEKDRIVLVKFDVILKEYHALKPQYQDVIADITKKMGNGMADYILDENFNLNGLQTVKDYDLYCHYVAGLVGEGLTNLIVLANFSQPSLKTHMELANSMGLFLQKTNIIRDFEEDLQDKRSFWPKEIWSKYAENLVDLTLPANLPQALDCSEDLVLNALGHVTGVLQYLSLIQDQSTFNFCAIPQVMAIATLDLVYQNPAIFVSHIKIRRGTTVNLIVRSRTLEGILEIFSEYIRSIHHKSKPASRNYLKIGVICGHIEQFIETMRPVSHLPQTVNEAPKSEVFKNVLARSHVEQKMKNVIRKENEKTNAVVAGGALILAVIGYLVLKGGTEYIHSEL